MENITDLPDKINKLMDGAKEFLDIGKVRFEKDVPEAEKNCIKNIDEAYNLLKSQKGNPLSNKAERIYKKKLRELESPIKDWDYSQPTAFSLDEKYYNV